MSSGTQSVVSVRYPRPHILLDVSKDERNGEVSRDLPISFVRFP